MKMSWTMISVLLLAMLGTSVGQADSGSYYGWEWALTRPRIVSSTRRGARFSSNSLP